MVDDVTLFIPELMKVSEKEVKILNLLGGPPRFIVFHLIQKLGGGGGMSSTKVLQISAV